MEQRASARAEASVQGLKAASIRSIHVCHTSEVLPSIFKTVYEVVNVERLAQFDETQGVITPELLYEAGITRGLEYPVKILGVGGVHRAVTVRAHKFSRTAQEKIEAAGGTVEVIE